jgi:hypothetical protein
MAHRQLIREIAEAMELCRKAGHEPVALLVNPKVSEMLRKELMDYSLRTVTINKIFGLTVTINEILGLTVFEHPKIKDFYLVDNRSWAEQKW